MLHWASLNSTLFGRLFVGGALTSALVVGLASNAEAVPVQVRGHAGLVGEYTTELTAEGFDYQAMRMPFSLTLEAKASSKVSLFLNISPSFNLSPKNARELGNGGAADISKRQAGAETTQPVSGGFRDPEFLSSLYAYLNYDSDVGLLTVGRTPRHWGLGLWKNAIWRPDAGAISTSDMVGLTLDFSSSLSGHVAFEKTNEGQPNVNDDDGEAFTVEVLLADDPADPSSSGLAKRIGVTFSSYTHSRTETDLSVLDMFGQFYLNRLLLESEILYPTGKSRSLGYGNLGGESQQCTTGQNPDGDDIACKRSTIEGLAAIARVRWLVSGGETADKASWSSLATVDAARMETSTSLTPESHEIATEFGFARGDSDAFNPASKDDTITGLSFHPNIRPALIMFSPAQPSVAGFPGSRVQNALYIKGSYTYETPGFGLISPSLIWGQLHKTAANDLLDTPGRGSDLGIEANLNYSYRTASRMTFGIDAGAHFAGDAYTVYTATETKEASVSYGVRATMSTSF